MTDIEAQMIGVCLNRPEAVSTVTDLSPECFTDAIYAEAWRRMQLVPAGDFTFATISADFTNDDGARKKLFDAFEAVDGYVNPKFARTIANKLLELHSRRQAYTVTNWIANGIEAGQPLPDLLAEHLPRLEGLRWSPGQSKRFKPVPIADLQPTSHPWLVKGVVPASGLGFIAGASGAGKSFLSLDLCLSLAAGHSEVLDRKAKPCGVVYIAAEDFEGCKGRVRAWLKDNHTDGDGLPFEMLGDPVNLMEPECVQDLVTALRAAGSRFADSGIGLGLIVVDTLSCAIPGADENNAQDMSRVIEALKLIAAKTGAFVLVVAHHGKAGSSAGVRGWSGQNAAADMTLVVERSEEDPSLRLVSAGKIKNAVDGAKWAFRLRRVGLGLHDEDGDELDSCVCDFEPLPEPQKAKPRLTAPSEIVLKAIRQETDNGKTYALPTGAQGQHWSRSVALEAVRYRAEREGLKMPGAEGGKADEVWKKAVQDLIRAGKIRVDTSNGLCWLV
ncbi:AAA family ATPase [Asticcacaulis sp.]|uniref:AAA family ATPase n=1 Tax=Asticcacaulis sp. TaxID=1872648 RepID=UPI0031D9E44B